MYLVMGYKLILAGVLGSLWDNPICGTLWGPYGWNGDYDNASNLYQVSIIWYHTKNSEALMNWKKDNLYLLRHQKVIVASRTFNKCFKSRLFTILFNILLRILSLFTLFKYVTMYFLCLKHSSDLRAGALAESRPFLSANGTSLLCLHRSARRRGGCACEPRAIAKR